MKNNIPLGRSLPLSDSLFVHAGFYSENRMVKISGRLAPEYKDILAKELFFRHNNNDLSFVKAPLIMGLFIPERQRLSIKRE